MCTDFCVIEIEQMQMKVPCVWAQTFRNDSLIVPNWVYVISVQLIKTGENIGEKIDENEKKNPSNRYHY